MSSNDPIGKGFQPGDPFETDPGALRTKPMHLRTRQRERLLPDWIIFGVPHEDSVTVYASAQLSAVSLERVATWFDELNHDRIKEGKLHPTPWTLYARIVGLYVGHGETYADAMNDLASKWTPDDSGSTTQRQRRVSIAELEEAIENEIDDDIIDAEIVDDQPTEGPTK